MEFSNLYEKHDGKDPFWIDHLPIEEQKIIEDFREFYPHLCDSYFTTLDQREKKCTKGKIPSGDAEFSTLLGIILDPESKSEEKKVNERIIQLNHSGNFIYSLSLHTWEKGALNSIEKLPESLTKSKNIQYIRIWQSQLKSFQNLPSSLKMIQIENSRISSFNEMPDELPNLERLIIRDCPLSSFHGLPSTLPSLRELTIEHTELHNLEFLPTMPKLKKLSLTNNKIIGNFAKLIDLCGATPMLFNGISRNAIISTYGLPRNFIKYGLMELESTWFHSKSLIPESYIFYLNPEKFHWQKPECCDEIYELFNTPPSSIARWYCEGKQLSQFELDRIVYEGNTEILKYLMDQIGPADEIVKKLAKHLDIDLKQGQFFL